MRIDDYGFGRIVIDGTEYAEDVVVLGGQVRSPWWREGGGHIFAPADLQEVIAAAPEVVVLGTGYFGVVRVLDETVAAFTAAGSRVVVERTGRAVKEYNRLVEERSDVAAALHLTC